MRHIYALARHGNRRAIRAIVKRRARNNVSRKKMRMVQRFDRESHAADLRSFFNSSNEDQVLPQEPYEILD